MKKTIVVSLDCTEEQAKEITDIDKQLATFWDSYKCEPEIIYLGKKGFIEISIHQGLTKKQALEKWRKLERMAVIEN